MKKLSQPIEKLLAPPRQTAVGLLGQKTDVANQVGHTELNGCPAVGHVFVVGREVVTADHATKGFAQHRSKDITATRRIDVKDRETWGTQAPSPMPSARVFVPRLVNAQTVLTGQGIAQFFIGPLDRTRNLLHYVDQLPTADVQSGKFLPETLDRRVRHVAGGLLESDGRRESRPNQACRRNLRRQRRDDDLAGPWIAIPPGSILRDQKRFLHQFHLLNDMPTRSGRNPRASLASNSALHDLIHFPRTEWLPLVLGVPRLPTNRTLAPMLGISPGRLDDITRRRFRAISGVLLQMRRPPPPVGRSALAAARRPRRPPP